MGYCTLDDSLKSLGCVKNTEQFSDHKYFLKIDRFLAINRDNKRLERANLPRDSVRLASQRRVLFVLC